MTYSGHEVYVRTRIKQIMLTHTSEGHLVNALFYGMQGMGG